MRIVCPSCAATYEIADGMLARLRTVRCSRCGTEWLQEPASTEVPAEGTGEVSDMSVLSGTAPSPAPVPSPPPVAAAPAVVPVLPAGLPMSKRAGSGRGLRLAWIASIALLVVLAVAAYRFRVEIQQAWPPSVRLFQLLPN